MTKFVLRFALLCLFTASAAQASSLSIKIDGAQAMSMFYKGKLQPDYVNTNEFQDFMPLVFQISIFGKFKCFRAMNLAKDGSLVQTYSETYEGEHPFEPRHYAGYHCAGTVDAENEQ